VGIVSPHGSKPFGKIAGIWHDDRMNPWEKYVVPRLIKCACGQPQFMKRRAQLVPKAQGDVLELGCGGGINLEFYDSGRVVSLAGIDPSPKLLDYCEQAAQRLGLPMRAQAGVGEALPFADASFDSIVVTFTLCSVQDNAQVVREMRRVLRPGGTILFLEHGGAPDPSVQRWQRRIEPVWKHIGGGCHLTRPISTLFTEHGFATHDLVREYMPKTPRPFGWVEYGEARPL
jgi:SAM-dependent methyltransferase